MPSLTIYLDDFAYKKLLHLAPKKVKPQDYARSLIIDGLATIEAKKKDGGKQ